MNSSPSPLLLDSLVICSKDFNESLNYLSTNRIYFTRADKEYSNSGLFTSEFVDNEWSPPKILPFFIREYNADLHFSPQEDVAFFTSKKNPQKDALSKAWNIWKVTKNGEFWDTPSVLGPPINSNAMECCLTMNKNGETYFASNRNGTWDIFSAKYKNGKFTDVQIVDNQKINTLDDEWPSFVSNQNDVLLFSSIRASGFGGDDIYAAVKKDGDWDEIFILDNTINSTHFEDNAVLSEDGKILFFSSKIEKSNGNTSNIYFMERKLVEGLD